ncbi:septum formation initiator family protein [Henriciella sp. AS95]|uniref:cell division protein FtsL n=1 Tax=Henriciella sp. AS95 TaxID=3135782 RepID=UPI003176FB16
MSRRALIVGVAIIGLLIFSLYRAKYGARESAEEIAAVEAEIDEAIRERRVLLGELSHLSRQEWVEEYARSELGMVPARAEQFARPEDLDHLIGPPAADDEAGEPRSEREGGNDG